jgi:hypothetical protein
MLAGFEPDLQVASVMQNSAHGAARPRAFMLWLGAAIVAAMLLTAQIMQQNREWLATHAHGPFGAGIRALYGAVGTPLPAPANLSAYQLRQWGVTGDPVAGTAAAGTAAAGTATAGTAAAGTATAGTATAGTAAAGAAAAGAPEATGKLRLRASILNTAAQLQPFPLLRVTLADRFGKKIGTRDFEPNEYLGKPTARLLAPGERTDAVLEILDPGQNAEGFEIDVCLRGADQRISCANDVAAQAKR